MRATMEGQDHRRSDEPDVESIAADWDAHLNAAPAGALCHNTAIHRNLCLPERPSDRVRRQRPPPSARDADSSCPSPGPYDTGTREEDVFDCSTATATSGVSTGQADQDRVQEEEQAFRHSLCRKSYDATPTRNGGFMSAHKEPFMAPGPYAGDFDRTKTEATKFRTWQAEARGVAGEAARRAVSPRQEDPSPSSWILPSRKGAGVFSDYGSSELSQKLAVQTSPQMFRVEHCPPGTWRAASVPMAGHAGESSERRSSYANSKPGRAVSPRRNERTAMRDFLNHQVARDETATCRSRRMQEEHDFSALCRRTRESWTDTCNAGHAIAAKARAGNLARSPPW